jgi:hypothetical protein
VLNLKEKKEVYECKNCKHNTLVVTKDENGTTGVCSNCGYSFKENKLSKLLSPSHFTFIYSIIAPLVCIILLTACIFMSSSQYDTANKKIDAVNTCLQTNISSIDNRISNMITSISTINTDIGNIFSRISTLETSTASLNTLFSNITAIRNNLTAIDQTIQSLQVTLNSTSSSNILSLVNKNFTITYPANQTGTERHCNFSFFLEEDDIAINEVKYMINCTNVTMNLTSYYGTFAPEINKYGNSTYSLYWFGKNKKIGANFTLNWNISDYNTSQIKSKLNHLLQLNSVFVNMPEIWEKEIP